MAAHEPAPPPPDTAPNDGAGATTTSGAAATAGDGGGATVASAAAAATPVSPPGASGTCGGRGQPPCPLQAYMKTKLVPAMRAGGETLAAELALVAGWAPDPTWNEGPAGWREVAEAGAAAARSGIRAGAMAACKRCHLAWQKRYRSAFRSRAIPSAPR